jgi:hypothetical protein
VFSLTGDLTFAQGRQPFTVDDEADSLADRLASIARLTEAEVGRTIKSISAGNAPLQRFLQGCLQIDPDIRETTRKLLAKGYISGDTATQKMADHGQDMDRFESKLNNIQEVQQDQHREVMTGISVLGDRIEAVRRTVINLEQSKVPCIFTVEMMVESGQPPPDTAQSKGLLRRLGTMLDPRRPLRAVRQAIDDLKGQRMMLQLLCQYTYEPVGHGYVIRAPKETLPVRFVPPSRFLLFRAALQLSALLRSVGALSVRLLTTNGCTVAEADAPTVVRFAHTQGGQRHRVSGAAVPRHPTAAGRPDRRCDTAAVRGARAATIASSHRLSLEANRRTNVL